MKRIAYFDCSSGIAGNMILGALLSLGVPESYLTKELKKVPLPRYRLIIKKIQKNKMPATYVEVELKGNPHDHHHYNLKNILRIIDRSKLDKAVKSKAKEIYKRMIRAESLVHKKDMDSVHLHEVGATDAIIDIAGSLICLKYLEIEEIYASPINVGSGKIRHSHGILPVPAPATAELLKGIPSFSNPAGKELATPTGAAIITSLAKSFGDIPRIRFERSGYGAGGHTIPDIPNVLRIILGEKDIQTETDAVLQIEANIDDMNPKLYDKAIKNIMKAGALDAWITPILMKKKRKAVQLSVICEIFHNRPVLDAFFSETTTFGVRTFLVKREKLKRKFVRVKTKYGKAKIKLGILDNKVVTAASEYEDYKRIAKKHSIPIQKAYREVRL
jgi:uncharacterized protein (TIGR00299 family) protein